MRLQITITLIYLLAIADFGYSCFPGLPGCGDLSELCPTGGYCISGVNAQLCWNGVAYCSGDTTPVISLPMSTPGQLSWGIDLNCFTLGATNSAFTPAVLTNNGTESVMIPVSTTITAWCSSTESIETTTVTVPVEVKPDKVKFSTNSPTTFTPVTGALDFSSFNADCAESEKLDVINTKSEELNQQLLTFKTRLKSMNAELEQSSVVGRLVIFNNYKSELQQLADDLNDKADEIEALKNNLPQTLDYDIGNSFLNEEGAVTVLAENNTCRAQTLSFESIAKTWNSTIMGSSSTSHLSNIQLDTQTIPQGSSTNVTITFDFSGSFGTEEISLKTDNTEFPVVITTSGNAELIFIQALEQSTEDEKSALVYRKEALDALNAVILGTKGAIDAAGGVGAILLSPTLGGEDALNGIILEVNAAISISRAAISLASTITASYISSCCGDAQAASSVVESFFPEGNPAGSYENDNNYGSCICNGSTCSDN